MGGLLVDQLDLFPFSVGFFGEYVYLVIAAGDRKHISGLAPTNLPKWNIFSKCDLLACPSCVVFTVALVLPDHCRFVFRAARDHILLQADVIAPCDISYPVLVLADLCLDWLLVILQLPHDDHAIVTSRNKPLGR